MEGMKEVTRDQFFAGIGNSDCHPSPKGNFPYTSYWKTRGGHLIGISTCEDMRTQTPARYYLPESRI